MNIDPMQLFPKYIDDFKFDKNGTEIEAEVAKLRLAHHNKKRGQTLAILMMRMRDINNGENIVTVNKYDRVMIQTQ